MPAKSKAQARFMGLVVSGKKKIKSLSREKAREFLIEIAEKHLSLYKTQTV